MIIKPYYCSHCGKYRWRRQVKSEYSRVQGQIIHKCKYCDRVVISVKGYLDKTLKEIESKKQ